jgi:hypothetical protein
VTQPIDVAYVDIVARTKEFRREIRDVIDDEVKELTDGLNEALDEIDKHFADTAKVADKALDDIDKSVKDTSTTIDTTLRESLIELGDESHNMRRIVGSNFDKMFLHAAENGQFVERNVTPLWRRAMTAIADTTTEAVKNVNSGFGTMLSLLASGPVLITAFIVALPGLIAILITLGAALADLLGLLGLIPGALAVILAIIAPLIIAFQNFGEALGAILEGDVDKINEALKKLSPSARAVAKEFAKILDPFRKLQLIVQEALFAPLVGDLAKLVKVIIGPLTTGLADVAGSIGRIISDFAAWAGSKQAIDTMNAVFKTTADILDFMGPAILEVVKAFADLAREALPTIQLLSDKFALFLVQFAEFIAEKIKDGSFQEFLDDALATVDAIFALIGSLTSLFGALFTKETADAGRELLDILVKVFDAMAKFLATQEGQQFLSDLAQLAIIATMALGGLLLILSNLLVFMTTALVTILDFFGVIERKTQEVGTAAQTMADTITNAVSGIPARLSALAGHFSNAGQNLINSFISGFRRSGNFIDDVAGDILRGIKGGLNRFIGSINSGIAALDALLPFSLSRIPNLAEGGIARANPGGTIVRVAEGGEDEVISPLSKLKEIIADAAGPGVVFGPGSINVNFDGVVPSTEEARTVGQAVGEGIISTLARRNIRSQLRAI